MASLTGAAGVTGASSDAAAAGTGAGPAGVPPVPPDELVAAWLQMMELRTLTLSSALQRLLALGKAVVCDLGAASAGTARGAAVQAPVDRLRDGVSRVLSQLRSVELLPAPASGASENDAGAGASSAGDADAAAGLSEAGSTADYSGRSDTAATATTPVATSNLDTAADLLARMRVETGRSANDLCAELGLPLAVVAGNPRALMDLLQAEQRANAAALAVQAVLALLAEAADPSCWTTSGAPSSSAALARLHLAAVQTALLSADQTIRNVDSPIAKILEATAIA